MTTERPVPSPELARELCSALIDGMLDPVITIDPYGTILDANGSCEKVFGYAPGELRGSNIAMIMAEPHRSEHDDYLARYRATGKTNILGETRTFPVIHKDGRRLEVELSVSRVDPPDGDTPVFIGSFRDVTDRLAAERALAASERLYRAIFDSEFQFVGVMHPDGTLVEVNRAALDAIGVQRDEVLGRPFWETPWWACSIDEQERLKKATAEAAEGGFVRFEAKQARKGGGVATFDFSLKPVLNENGEVVLLLPEGRDITDLQAARQRELAMMRAFAEIGEASSVLAHEIKNPITAVNLSLRAVAKQLGEDEQRVLGELVERMQGLERLMRRTLSLARPVDLRVREVVVRDLLEAALRGSRRELDAAGIRAEVEVPEQGLRVEVDPDLFEEVFTNLLKNTVEALQGPGRVRLFGEGSSREVLLFLEDDGPGVPEEFRIEAMKAFVSSKSDGTGLGLAIVRKIVEAHGGTIEIGTGSLGGARFTIRLPRESSAG